MTIQEVWGISKLFLEQFMIYLMNSQFLSQLILEE